VEKWELCPVFHELCPESGSGPGVRDRCYRRRLSSVKVLLSLRLFAAARPGLSDTCLPEIPIGVCRKQTSNKGAEQGVPVPPRPAARFRNYLLLERGHIWPVIHRRENRSEKGKPGCIYAVPGRKNCEKGGPQEMSPSESRGEKSSACLPGD